MSGRGFRSGRWSAEEDAQLLKGVNSLGPRNWERISQEFLGSQRSAVQALHRYQKCLRPGLRKGPWTAEEDNIITAALESGITKWAEVAKLVP